MTGIVLLLLYTPSWRVEGKLYLYHYFKFTLPSLQMEYLSNTEFLEKMTVDDLVKKFEVTCDMASC
jgi:hypothetical protein